MEIFNAMRAWKLISQLNVRLNCAAAAAVIGTNLNPALVVSAVAQTAADTIFDDSILEEIIVTAKRIDGYRTEASSLTKLTEDLQNTPQTISMVSRELMEDRGLTSLNDALRTVPSITLGAGEFSWQGNNPSIRGFSSRSDMFLDGIRDFGSYYRDPFNLETIEVLEGPSSMIFGRGSTGGVINQVSKVPGMEQFGSVSINLGSDQTRRGTMDIGGPLQLLGDSAAFRVNAMAHQSEAADRDGGQAERYGVAPSLALGLGTPTRVNVSYLHQSSDDTPDYGLPWYGADPAPVPRNNFYGFQSDFLNTDADIATVALQHEFTDDLNLLSKVRYANYTRDSRLTEPLISAAVPLTTPVSDVSVDRNVFLGSSEETMLLGQLDLIAEFATGASQHSLVIGIELGHESSTPTFGFGVGVPSTNLLVPDLTDQFSATSTEPRLKADTEGKSLAIYALDTIRLSELWQFVLGVRWDEFDVDYVADRFSTDGDLTGTESIQRVDREASYRAAVVFKPRPTGTIYFGGGTSFNPSAEDLSFITSGRGLSVSNSTLAPEQNRTFELGTKWGFLGDGVILNAAIFRIEKANARMPDPNNQGFNILAGNQRVDGVSLNFGGLLTSRWQLTAGYTFLDSKTIESLPGGPPVGGRLLNAPEHSFSVWTSYQLSDRLSIGGGARYMSDRLARNVPPIKKVSSYSSFDLMGAYQISAGMALKLNLTNVTDEYYFDQLHPWHVVPSSGITAMLALNVVY
jgi:catecholate siderophore receptor